MHDEELDVRLLHKSDRHPAIFRAYGALAVGESFVVVNDHDPEHLRGEFELDHAGGYGWDYLDRGAELWRIRISKLATTPLPHILCDTATVAAPRDPLARGAVWRLLMRQRDLDSNIIRLPPDASIDEHRGPDLDVLLIVLHGTGQLTTELDTLELRPGALVWLPRRSWRQFTAGFEGLSYLTVHQRRQSLVLDAGAHSSAERRL